LDCKENKKEKKKKHPNSKSGRKVQQKMVEDVSSAAEIAIKQNTVRKIEASFISEPA
jgi:hypothetical protein